MRWDLFLLGLLLCALFLWLTLPMARRSASVKRRAKTVMVGRESLTARQFADSFFEPAQRAVAEKMSELLRNNLIVDVARIRPDDHLVADLGMGHVDGLDGEWLFHDLQDHFGVSIFPAFEDRDPTVRELVEFCSSQATASPRT